MQIKVEEKLFFSYHGGFQFVLWHAYLRKNVFFKLMHNGFYFYFIFEKNYISKLHAKYYIIL